MKTTTTKLLDIQEHSIRKLGKIRSELKLLSGVLLLIFKFGYQDHLTQLLPFAWDFVAKGQLVWGQVGQTTMQHTWRKGHHFCCHVLHHCRQELSPLELPSCWWSPLLLVCLSSEPLHLLAPEECSIGLLTQ